MRHADKDCGEGDTDCDTERVAGPEDYAREDIAAKIIGPEPVLRARRFETAHDVGLEGIVREGNDVGSRETEEDRAEDDEEPDQRRPVSREDPEQMHQICSTMRGSMTAWSRSTRILMIV